MSTQVTKTPHKEIHEEQKKRVEGQHKMEKAVKEGKLPDNKEIDTAIDNAKKGINQNDDKLSSTGKAVTKDINNILDTTQKIVKEKNEGDALQNAYYHSHQAGGNKNFSSRINELKQIASGDSSATRSEAKKNVSSLGTIVKLAILSPEFRETINDMATISNMMLKNQSEKQDKKSSEKSESTKTTIEPRTEIKQRNPTKNGDVEATVVETVPVEVKEHKKTKEEKREELEDKLVERLVDLAETLHKNPEYRNSIEYLSSSAEKLKSHGKEKKQQMDAKKAEDKSKENTAEIKYHNKQARQNGKRFLENWIGDDYSLDPLLKQLRFLYKESKNDEELRQLLKDWNTWSTKTVKDSSYIEDKEKVRSDTKDLIHRTRSMATGKYQDQAKVIREEVNYINRSIQRDDTVTELQKNFSQLARDIVKDSNGQPCLKPELLNDAQIIIGNLLNTIKYIPLPPIKRQDENMDLELENIVLNVTDVTPSNVRFIVQADTDKATSGSRQSDNSFIIEISKIRAHLTSVNFFVDKRTGFPKITERGLADIDLARNGLSLKIEIAPKMETFGKSVRSVFEAKTVTCNVDKLKIHLRKTSHDGLYKLLSPIINMVAKSKIQNGIEGYIKDNMNQLNSLTSQKATLAAKKTDQKVKEKERTDY